MLGLNLNHVSKRGHRSCWLNSSPPGQNGHHFADDIFKCLFLNENVWISINISLKCSVNNIRALVQIMAWRSMNQLHSKPILQLLTHWGRMMHICVSKSTIISSDNGLLPGCCLAIIWTNAAILLSRPLGTNLHEILVEIHTFSFKKICLKMASGKWRPFCRGLNVLSFNLKSYISNLGTWAGLILCFCPANERRRYNVTPSLIGWA